MPLQLQEQQAGHVQCSESNERKNVILTIGVLSRLAFFWGTI